MLYPCLNTNSGNPQQLKPRHSVQEWSSIFLHSFSITLTFWDYWICCRVSSVSIMSDYLLYDRAIGVRSPAGAKDFSSILCVQTGSGAHPASCPMGTGGPFPGGKKRGRGVTLTTHPHLMPRSWMSRSYNSSPPKRLHGVQRDCFTFFLVNLLLFWVFLQCFVEVEVKLREA
jgi:hypothetical protein